MNAGGDAASCIYPSSFSTQGFIRDWLLLGPYRQPPGPNLAAPGEEAIRRDHLVNADGSLNEFVVRPRAGDTVDTDYGPDGCARSIGLANPGSGNPNGINPGGIPAWQAWRPPEDTVDFNAYYGGDLNGVMMNAVTYIDVPEDLTVDVGLASDDSIQVLLDGKEIHIRNLGRWRGGPDTVQDVVFGSVVPGLSPLSGGRHKLMVKVFEGTGGHAFRLRFQDPVTGEHVVPGRITLDPGPPQPPPEASFRRGDSDGDGAPSVSDAIQILGWLFLEECAPGCPDSADANDDQGVDISDPLYVLFFLFAGGEPPPLPGPFDCGPDPTEDRLQPCDPQGTGC